MLTKSFNLSRRSAAIAVSLLLATVGVAAPARATVATAPTGISITQSNSVVSATVTVPEGESVGSVSASIGSAPAVAITEVDGAYPLSFSASDIGKTVYFYATAVGPELDESFPPTSQSYVLRTAKKPTSISVSQNGMTVTATPVLAAGTEVGVVTVRVGNALTPTVVDPVDGAYSVTLNRSDLMSSIVFTATAIEAGFPDSEVRYSSPFMFEAATAPYSVSVTQSGLNFTGHISLPVGEAIGTVTVQVGSADPETVTPVNGNYIKTLERSDLGKHVVFWATATKSGKAESAAVASSPYTSASASAPTSVTVTQSNLTVTAHITVPVFESIGVVTVKVGDDDAQEVTPVGGVYSTTLTRAQLGSTVVFSATATATNLPESDPTSSAAFTFSAADAPTSINVSQSGFTVSAQVMVNPGQNVGTVTATVGSADPVTVAPSGLSYSLTLTRADAGKSIVFTATATASGKAVSDATSSDAYTFGVAAAPTSIIVTQNDLTVSAAVTFADGTSAGTVTAKVGSASPVTVSGSAGNYSVSLTRLDLGKSVTFTASGVADGLPDSEVVASEPFTFSAAPAPSLITVTRDGRTLTAHIFKSSEEEIGTVTVQIGSGSPTVLDAVDGEYSVTLSRTELGKDVVFSATATQSGKAESTKTQSEAFNLTAAVAPRYVVATQAGSYMMGYVGVGIGESVGTVTVQVGDGSPEVITPVNGNFSIALTRDDLGKSVVFTATATAEGKEESDVVTSNTAVFSAANAPTVTATQKNLVVTAGFGLGGGDSVGTVTATVGDADPIDVPYNFSTGKYSIELTRADAGKSVIFTATANHTGLITSEPASSEPLTFALAATPTAISVTQDNLTVSAAVTWASNTTAQSVMATIGDTAPVLVPSAGAVYSVTLTRADLGKTVIFTAVGQATDLPDSESYSSEPFTFSAATAPSAVTLSQSGLDVTANITVEDGSAIGAVTATVGDGPAQAVSQENGTYKIHLLRTDAGKSVVFSATATTSGFAESAATSSDPLTVALAAAPTAIDVTQDDRTVSAVVTWADGTTPHVVWATVDGYGAYVVPVGDAYVIHLSREELGKTVVFSAVSSQSDLPDSDVTVSSPFIFGAATAPSSVVVSQNGLVVSAAITVADGSAIGTVTAKIGDADAIEVSPVDDGYSVELTRADAGKNVIFTATATASGKTESEVTTSAPLAFALAAAPTSIDVSQNDLTVSAQVTWADGTTPGTVTATVGDGDLTTLDLVDGRYSVVLTREDLGKAVTFSAVASATNLPDSDALTSSPLTLGAATAPTSVTATQDGFNVTANISVGSDEAIGTVMATVGDSDPVEVTRVRGKYSIELGREDAGKAIVFSATATKSGLAESEATTSEPLTFAVTAAPTAIAVVQSNLTVTASVSWAEDTAPSAVYVTVGEDEPVLLDSTGGDYAVTLTRADLGKTVIFTAVAGADGLPSSDLFSSEPFTFSAANAPSAVTLTQNGLDVTASITVDEDTAIGAVTATVGENAPVTVVPDGDVYSITLTRADAGKAIVFSATATQDGKAESEVTSSDPLTFAVAAAPTSVVVTQSDLTVTAVVTWADGTTPGAVTAVVGDADPVTVDLTDDAYPLTLTREDLGKTVTFSAVATADGLPDSDSVSSEPFTFSAATAPSAVTVTQNGFDLTAHVALADGETVGTVTVQLGDDDPMAVDAVDGEYVVTIAPEDADKTVIFTATALADGVAESNPTSSDPYTLQVADAPTSVVVTQHGLTVQATIEVGSAQAIGTVTATIGDEDPVTVDPVDGVYSVELTRDNIGQDVIFSATATQDGLPESAATNSDAITIAAAEAPTSVTIAQIGMDVVATIEVPDGTSIGSVTAVVDGGDPIDVPLVGSDYRLTLTREDFDKVVTFSVTGASADLPESDPLTSDELTYAASAAPKTLFIGQSGLRLTVAGFVACGGDPATYGTLGSVTMSVDGSDPETLTVVGGRASKTLTRADLGKQVIVTGTGVCGVLPESDPVTRDPYTFRVAPSPTMVRVSQSNLTVLARPVLSKGEKVGVVTVSIDGSAPTVVAQSGTGYRVTLTRADFGKSIVFTATARLARYADSDPTSSDPFVFSSAAQPTDIVVTQRDLTVTAVVTVPAKQTVGVVTLSVGGASPVTLTRSAGGYSATLTRADLGKNLVFTAVSRKIGLADSDAYSSAPFAFSAAATPTSVTVHQSGVNVIASVTVPDGQSIGRVTVSVDGGSPSIVRHTSAGYVKRLTHASNGKSVVFHITSTKSGKAISDVYSTSPFTFVG